MEAVTKPVRTLKGRAFLAFGVVAIVLQVHNPYLFIGMITIGR
jgi:hypothetical protein